MPKQRKKSDYHLRLYDDDVAALKRLALELEVPWQAYLRLLLHRTLDAKKKGRIA